MMDDLKNKQLKVDETDVMILRELGKDGRLSYKTLASKVGASRPTMRRRLKRLIDLKIATITPIVSFTTLGYGTIVILAINTPPGKVETTVKQLSSADSIRYMWTTAGRFDIMAVAMYQNPEEFLETFSEKIGTLPENIRIETLLTIRFVKSTWPHLIGGIFAVDSKPSITLTELDFSILRGLEKSPRATVIELAKDIKEKSSSVRSSLRKLTSEGIVRVICIPDPSALGYTVEGITLVQVRMDNLKSLTDKLDALPFVRGIIFTFGAFNCMIWTSFQNSDQMSDFLSHDLGNMHGVVHFESLVILKWEKKNFNLLNGQ